MGIKESTSDELWVIYGSVESLYGIPETNITRYVNWSSNKKINKLHT